MAFTVSSLAQSPLLTSTLKHSELAIAVFPTSVKEPKSPLSLKGLEDEITVCPPSLFTGLWYWINSVWISLLWITHSLEPSTTKAFHAEHEKLGKLRKGNSITDKENCDSLKQLFGKNLDSFSNENGCLLICRDWEVDWKNVALVGKLINLGMVEILDTKQPFSS